VIRLGHGVIPLGALKHHVRVRQLRVAAGVIVVEMRVDQMRDLTRRDRERVEARGDFFTGRKYRDVRFDAFCAEVAGGVGLRAQIHAAVEQHLAARMHHHVSGHRHGEPASGLRQEEG
jgi:hypothetical protein